MVMLEAGKLPRWRRWPAGRAERLAFTPLWIQNFGPSFAEVLPNVPERRFRVRTRIENNGRSEEYQRGAIHHTRTTSEDTVSIDHFRDQVWQPSLAPAIVIAADKNVCPTS